MNCKPADLAVIVYPCQWQGWLVRVIEAAPLGHFLMPDGHLAERGHERPSWICESLMTSVFCNPCNVGFRFSRFAIIPDYALRPLRDGEGRDETLDWAPVPHELETTQ